MENCFITLCSVRPTFVDSPWSIRVRRSRDLLILVQISIRCTNNKNRVTRFYDYFEEESADPLFHQTYISFSDHFLIFIRGSVYRCDSSDQ